jgi:hypothetical protein
MGKMMDDDLSIERVIQYNNFVSNRRSDMHFLTQKDRRTVGAFISREEATDNHAWQEY